MNNQRNIPIYEVQEVSLKQAILLIASEHKKEHMIDKKPAKKMFQL